MKEKVCYLELNPSEFRKRLAQKPVGYLPLGTLEWHGEQNPLGVDAIISKGLFERAAKQWGGIVFPPLFLGPDRIQSQTDGSTLIGMDTADVTTPHRRLDGSCYWVDESLFSQICEAILVQAKRAGFQCIMADGHGPSRKLWAKGCDEWEKRLGLKLISVHRDFKDVWCGMIDHAGKNETSMTMALRPDLVDLSKLSSDRSIWPQGVSTPDPRDATAEYGEECLSKCVDLVGAKLKKLGF